MEILRIKLVRGTPRQADGAVVVGVFMAKVGDIVLEGCQIIRRADGWLVVSLPTIAKLSRSIKRGARFADQATFHRFREMALEAFVAAGGSVDDEPEDYGSVRRVLGAEDESLQMAGL